MACYTRQRTDRELCPVGQYPIYAGYAFTDHKVQGQTLEWVIIDIGTTDKFPVTPFTAFMALLHSRSREMVWLLHDFDDTIFTQHPSHYLHLEDEHLECLNTHTRDRYKVGYYDFAYWICKIFTFATLYHNTGDFWHTCDNNRLPEALWSNVVIIWVMSHNQPIWAHLANGIPASSLWLHQLWNFFFLGQCHYLWKLH